MKKLLLLLLCCFTFYSDSAAQNYTPFPENIAVWDVYFQPREPDIQAMQFTRYLMKGDTVINSIPYNKVYSYAYTIYSPPKSIVLNKKGAFGIRQDITGKKVYRSLEVNNKIVDTLLYDFDLHVGDTVPVTFTTGNMTSPQTVLSIDSITFHGKKYRRFKLNTIGMNNATLIEGVGNANGLIEPHYGFFEAANILENFCNSDHSDCSQDLALAIKPIEAERFFNLFPNPFTTELTVNFDTESAHRHITVTDLLGKEIAFFENVGRQLSIKKDQLKNGIYLLKIVDEKGVFTEKIVVQ